MLFSCVSSASTPAPPALPNPNLDLVKNGIVYAIARLADGSTVLGGGFSEVGGVPRANIAKLLPNGSIDPSWNPGADAVVRALAIDEAGAIYAGGDFTTVGGSQRGRIAKISSDSGTVDTDWNPSATAAVYAIVADHTGHVYVGGSFSAIGGQSGHLARISTIGSGAADSSWNPQVTGTVWTIALDSGTDSVVAGGLFTQVVQGVQLHYLAKYSVANAAVDQSWKPAPDNVVRSIACDGNGSVYVAGDFSSIGGQQRTSIAKLSAAGTGRADAAWAPNADDSVYSLSLDGSGSIYASGFFANIGGRQQPRLAKLSTEGNGAATADWSPEVDDLVFDVVVDSDGFVWAGGFFATMNGQDRWGVAVLDLQAAVVSGIPDVSQPAIVSSLTRQASGSTIVGGDFLRADGLSHPYVLKQLSDGTLDQGWNPGSNGRVLTLAVGSDDSIFAGGEFTEMNGAAHLHIAKLAGNGAGEADASWNASADSTVRILKNDGGALYAGGDFATFNGQPRRLLAKMGQDGVLDPTWKPSPNGPVNDMVPDGLGNVFVAGGFTSISGKNRSYLAKLSSDGANVVDDTWTIGTNGYVFVLALDGSDLYLGGDFSAIGGHFHPFVGRISTLQGGSVATWSSAPDNPVYSLYFDSHRTLYMGGSFGSVSGVAASHVAAIPLSSTNTAVAADWNPAPSGLVQAIVENADGSIELGGNFAFVGQQARYALAAVPRAVVSTTTTIISENPVAAFVGQPYVVSFATVSTAGVATGEVVVRDDFGRSCGPVVLAGGQGSCTLSSDHAGMRQLVATYVPSNEDVGSSMSDAVAYRVEPARTLTTIVSQTPEKTTPAQPFVVEVALSVQSPGAGLPTGTVTVGDGIDACSIPQGQMSCNLTLTTRGDRNFVASYPGDANFAGSQFQAHHVVNQLPLASTSAYQGFEDTQLGVAAANGVLAGASDPDGDPLSIANVGTFTAAGIGGTIVLNADGSFSYTPPADANGTATFDYVISDGLETVTSTATITVNAVNDPPTFALAPTTDWPAGTSGAKSQAGFANVTGFGPPDEANQHVQAWIVHSIADPAGVASSVAIALDGTLTYALSGHAGTATFGVKLQDDGGNADGGIDTSAEQTFAITVAAGLDLSIRVDDGSDFAVGGGTVRYTIVVHNAGPNDAIHAQVHDLLPFNLVDAMWTCVASKDATCAPEGSGDIADTVTIPNGATLTYLLDASVLSDPETPVENTVTVVAPAGIPDAVATNNTSTDIDAVGIFADAFDREIAPKRQTDPRP